MNFKVYLKNHSEPILDVRSTLNIYTNQKELGKTFENFFGGFGQNLEKLGEEVTGLWTLYNEDKKTFDAVGVLIHEFAEMKRYNDIGFAYSELLNKQFYREIDENDPEDRGDGWKLFKWLAHSDAWLEEHAFYQRICNLSQVLGEKVPFKAFYLASPYMTTDTSHGAEWMLRRFFEGNVSLAKNNKKREQARREYENSTFSSDKLVELASDLGRRINLNKRKISNLKRKMTAVKNECNAEITEEDITNAIKFFELGGYNYGGNRENVFENAKKCKDLKF